ncbi:Uncharacterized protein FKW44_014418 [Caligus rogercresseyi]|uniref:Uncharacterized protein n=1 Tax=Caligus rogercresseyi TaxID=217165 RepID=A0A7T8GYW4_CALRO|nr:Uncharacterized protein FKW44_014418 [Caligus rogercresseyi]
MLRAPVYSRAHGLVCPPSAGGDVFHSEAEGIDYFASYNREGEVLLWAHGSSKFKGLPRILSPIEDILNHNPFGDDFTYRRVNNPWTGIKLLAPGQNKKLLYVVGINALGDLYSMEVQRGNNDRRSQESSLDWLLESPYKPTEAQVLNNFESASRDSYYVKKSYANAIFVRWDPAYSFDTKWNMNKIRLPPNNLRLKYGSKRKKIKRKRAKLPNVEDGSKNLSTVNKNNVKEQNVESSSSKNSRGSSSESEKDIAASDDENEETSEDENIDCPRTYQTRCKSKERNGLNNLPSSPKNDGQESKIKDSLNHGISQISGDERNTSGAKDKPSKKRVVASKYVKKKYDNFSKLPKLHGMNKKCMDKKERRIVNILCRNSIFDDLPSDIESDSSFRTGSVISRQSQSDSEGAGSNEQPRKIPSDPRYMLDQFMSHLDPEPISTQDGEFLDEPLTVGTQPEFSQPYSYLQESQSTKKRKRKSKVMGF